MVRDMFVVGGGQRKTHAVARTENSRCLHKRPNGGACKRSYSVPKADAEHGPEEEDGPIRRLPAVWRILVGLEVAGVRIRTNVQRRCDFEPRLHPEEELCARRS